MVELLLEFGGRLSLPGPPHRSDEHSTGQQSDQPRLTRLLLGHRGIISWAECREMYLSLVSRAELGQMLERTVSSKTSSARLVSRFSSILRKAAEIPDPIDIEHNHCMRCTAFQQRAFASRGEPFMLHPDREALVECARKGCQLCSIFADTARHSGE